MKFTHITESMFMIKKLELRHIAPYLPYKLKVSKYHTLHHGNGIGSIEHMLVTKNSCFKPILKNIRDLDTDKLTEHLLGNNSDAINMWVDFFNSDSQNKETAILTAPYPVIEYCFMNHFDVFGLINSKLAIDINTFKND